MPAPDVGPHPFVAEQPSSARACLLFVGPDRVCARPPDDPVHAVRLTEATDTAEAAATATEIKTGSWVSWQASGATQRGRVSSVHRRGTVPAVGHVFLTGTEADPAARVKVYEKDGDGWKPAGRYVAQPISALSQISDLPAPASEAINGQRSASDTRELLCTAIEQRIAAVAGISYAYVYVVDFTDTELIYSAGDSLYQCAYTISGVTVALGDPTPVIPQTVYVPRPATESTGPAEPIEATEQPDRIVGRVIEAKGTDETGGRVFGVRIIAYGDSRNGRRYPESVLQSAVPLYEGAKAYDHHRDDGELRSSTITGLVGYYRDVAALDDGLHGDLHLLPSATHAAEALDASLAAQTDGMAPLVGISHDVMATYRPLVDGGRRLQEATAITKVNSADIVADPAAGGKAVRMVAGGEEPADDDTTPPTTTPVTTKEGNMTAPAAGSTPAPPQTGAFNPADYFTVEQALALLRAASPAQLAEATGLAGSMSGQPAAGAGAPVTRKDSFFGKLMIEQKVTDSGLPSPTVEAIYKALPDRITEADVDAHIVAIKASLGVLEKANLAPSAGIKVTKEALDRKTEALDAFFSGDYSKGYHSFKQAYADFTGVRTGQDLFAVDWNRRILQESFGAGFDSSMRVMESMDSTSWNLVLGDSITRRMVAEYNQPNLQSWQQVVSSIVPVNDFRQQRIDRIGGYGTLPVVNQGAPYQPLNSPPNEEVTYTITKKGGTEDITLEMIANDDVRAISKIPTKLGLAAAQTLYRFVWDILNPGAAAAGAPASNPLIYDGVALYAAGHNNTATTALAGSALSTIRQKMRAQTAYGDSSDVLGFIPRTLVVANTLEELAWELVTSAVALPAAAPVGAASNIPNLHAGTQLVIVDYWPSTTGWMVIADTGMCPTLEVGFYQGQRDPQLFTQADPNYGTVFNADKISYKIRHIYSGAVLDYRGFQRGNT